MMVVDIDRVKSLLDGVGKTQSDLAKSQNVSPVTVSGWFNCGNKISHKSACRIVRGLLDLKVPMSDIQECIDYDDDDDLVFEMMSDWRKKDV